VRLRSPDARYEAALDGLADQLGQALVLAESMVQEALASVFERDTERGRRVLDDDARMDALEVEIDRRVLAVLALHRPVATDLRWVVTTSRAMTDLERIGDLAGAIARVGLELSPHVGLQPDGVMRELGQEVTEGLTELREGWHRDDVTVLGRVREAKDRVGELTEQARSSRLRDLAAYPDQAHRILALAELAAALARIAEHLENLAEQTVYRVEGRDLRHSR